MDVREKTAALSTALNVSLTVLKFVLYGWTGSLAILAEAWHSFSDIATSSLTFAAVRRTVRKEQAEGGNEDPTAADPPAPDQVSSPSGRPAPSAEQVASLIIGVVILIAGLSLVTKVVWHQPVIITRPLLAGVLFLIFALGSYLIHRLEVDVGERTGSSGLVADGMHARADMIASLLTGVSLVLYHLGFNLDRLIAALIAALVLSVALETIVNLIVGYTRGETRYVPRYRSHEIVVKVLSLTWLLGALHQLGGQASMPDWGTAVVSRVKRWSTAVLVIVAAGAYGRTCFFSVGLQQEGIVEHLGKPSRRSVQPGLHVKWPWPVDRVILIDRTTVNVTRVGNETDPQAFALIWTREHGTEVPFLSGDDNLFYPYVVIHWRVRDAFDAVYRQQDPAALLDAVSHRVMSDLCAKREFYDLASTYRRQLAEDIRVIAQTRLDELDSGLEIVSVNLSDIHPPVYIADSFEEVVVARFQEQQQLINEALGYRNEQLPDAAGRAAKQKAKAARYRSEQVSQATGRGKAFTLRADALRTGRDITFARLYLDYVVDALRGIGKVLIDADAGRPDLWMGFRGPMGEALTPGQTRMVEDLREQLK